MKRLMEKLGVRSASDFWKLAAQFVKFGLVGISNTAVHMGVYYLILWINPELYMVGYFSGTVISILNAFIWNNRFVFTGNAKDAKSILRRLGRTFVTYGGTGLLSNVLLWLEVSLLDIGKGVAPVINLLITIPLNFLINKLWAFKR